MGSTLDNFHPAFVWAVNQGLAACPGASIGSGYRTPEEQAALLYKRDQGIAVADPGKSRHQGNYGGAVDVSGDIECFKAAVAPLGLHQGVPGEDWHFEFTDEAWAMVEAGTYEYGQEPAQQEDQGLGNLRSIIFGGAAGGAGDIPARVASGMAEDQPTAAPVPEAGPAPLTAGAGNTGDPISDVEAARYFAAAGFQGDALVTMLATAMGESGLDPNIEGDGSLQDSTWGTSIGLSQIRSLRDQYGTGGWRDASKLADPAFNAKAAWAISNGGTNFGPWTIYKTGKYQDFVARAKAAVAALGSAAVGPEGSAAVASTEPEVSDLGDLTPDPLLFDPAGVASDLADMLLRASEGDSILEKAGITGTIDKQEAD